MTYRLCVIVLLSMAAIAAAFKLGISPSFASLEPSPPARHINLAVRFVVYKDAIGNPVTSQSEVLHDLDQTNRLWSQCNISFQMDQYIPVSPPDAHLTYGPSNYTDLDLIRGTYLSNEDLLVVVTGKWDRAGTLGTTPANAWTSLPGVPPYGAVLEQPVGNYANMIAHELGHYLSLDHVNDRSALMNPIIYRDSVKIYDGECAKARTAALQYWGKMIH